MIKLKDLFYAIAYCNQHIKTHKDECKAHGISTSRFYNIKQDVVKFLIENQKTFGLGVSVNSHEVQHLESCDVFTIGIQIKTQSLDELQVHQLYQGDYRKLIPESLLPALTEYVPRHTFEAEWDEQEFVNEFQIILDWVKNEKLNNFYTTLADSYFVQKMTRWYNTMCFSWDERRKLVFIKKKGFPKGKGKAKYGISEFRKNTTLILNNMESS